mgnify:CR=1 FL=1
MNTATTPGDAMRAFFSSYAAKTKGSYNLAGIENPAIDALMTWTRADGWTVGITVAQVDLPRPG